MKNLRNLLLVVLLVLCLALQVSAVDGKATVPEEEIVYKQDKLYVYVAPALNLDELYCQVQYGVDNSFVTSRMTPVEGKENVWVIENLPDEITGIGPMYYDGDIPVGLNGFEISKANANDNMCLCYSTGFGEWCTYDPDAHYEDNEITPESNMGPCGEKATYTLYDDGLLVIEGEGAVIDWAFADRHDFSRVEIRDGITHLGRGVFYMSSVVEVDMADSIISIGNESGGEIFGDCAKLESIKLSKNLTELSTDMFRGCTGLKEVVIPEGVKSIGYGAFYECTSLQEIKLPESLTSIGEAAFFGCSSLEEVVIPDSVTTLNGGDPLGTAGLGAFGNCTNLKSITIGKGVELIPWGFFGSDVLETLIIPEGVKEIDAYAFCFCPSLTYVEIPASVEYIGGFAFVDNFSMTNIVFKGDPPDQMDGMMGICGDYITASFYPKDAPGWADAYTGTAAMIPYTLDAKGNIIPEAPAQSEVLAAMEQFRSGEYFNYVRDLSAGKAYPNSYRYYINGTFHEGKGSEAFAFELSDACFGFLPISGHRKVVYADLRLGDLLYMDDQVWVIGQINANGVKVHGAEKEVIVYDRSLTKAQVETADSYRTRYGVSPGPGVVNPDAKLKPAPVPAGVPTEAEVYRRILTLQADHPEGMPFTEKNMYYCNVQALIKEGESTNPFGSGCSAFGYLASDTAFGDLPARYVTADKLDYDSIMVGDNLIGWRHQVVVLEVYENCLIIAEGNYNKMMHWGRIMTREEVEDGYDLFTRYPEGTKAPQRTYYEIPEEPEETLPPVTEPEQTLPMENPFTDIGEEKEKKPYYYDSVLWAVNKGITTGKTETSFAPNDTCTRNQIVTFLWRAAGQPEPASSANPFPDVPDGKYYTKAVLWAVEQGITAGYKDGTFGPNKACTRSQVVTFLWRAAGQPEPVSSANPFSDVPEGMFYTKAVLWAVENGITTGKTATTFQPDAICTRAQIVTFLYRSMA